MITRTAQSAELVWHTRLERLATSRRRRQRRLPSFGSNMPRSCVACHHVATSSCNLQAVATGNMGLEMPQSTVVPIRALEMISSSAETRNTVHICISSGFGCMECRPKPRGVHDGLVHRKLHGQEDAKASTFQVGKTRIHPQVSPSRENPHGPRRRYGRG